ncbi:MAG: glutathione S-transferase N-terminal domain-containing protein [Thiotrichaceae bacterium]|nr:glutathione S-transferase N-terminal domain-containing protein [Thiotrichaceae bacterium]
MLTLYQFDSCPFCWKVKALLNYTQQEYKVVEVSPLGMKEIDFIDHKKVPILTDDDEVITESASIVEYINQHYCKLPKGEGATKWVLWIDNILVHYLPPLIHPNFLTSFSNFKIITKNTKMGFIKRKIAQFIGAIFMPKVSRKIMLKHNIVDVEKEFLQAIDKWVDSGLQGRQFFGGEKADFIDCSVFGVLYSSHALGPIDDAKKHNPTFAIWYDHCRKLMTKN